MRRLHASGTCSPTNRCGGVATGAACTTSPNNCAIVGGKCSVSNAACTTNANCPTVAGTCSVSGTSCTSNANCPATGTGTCSISGAACTVNAELPDGLRRLQCQFGQRRDRLHMATLDCTTKPRYCSNQPHQGLHGQQQLHDRRHVRRDFRQRRRRVQSQLGDCTTKPGTCDVNAVNAGGELHQRLELHARRPASAA